MSALRGLVEAAHIGPSLAVTSFGVAWGAWAVGLPGAVSVILGVALLTGQLSIGWCNDWVDAPRDRAAGRTDKPVARGDVSRNLVAMAGVAAAVACVLASVSLGLLPAAVHLMAVASAWSYNIWLKTVPLSPLPYAVSFALLPAVATTAADPPRWPGVAVMGAAAALGVAAHFANTVGDTAAGAAAADAATGVRGLPQRVGPRASMVVMAVLVAVAATTLLAGAERPGPIGTAALVAGTLLAVGAAVWSWRVAAGKAAFRVTLVAVALVVGGFLASGVQPPGL